MKKSAQSNETGLHLCLSKLNFSRVQPINLDVSYVVESLHHIT